MNLPELLVGVSDWSKDQSVEGDGEEASLEHVDDTYKKVLLYGSFSSPPWFCSSLPLAFSGW